MKGAIIGDIAGSIYEFDETAESLDFPLFVKNSRFTDDTVTTVAVAPYVQGSLRVRYHGDVARIEVAVDEIPSVLAHREEIVRAIKDTGFTYVTLDLGGYEMGSLNDVIHTDEEVK